MAGLIKGLRSRVPWWARIGGKLVLSRLPVPSHVWQRIGVFSSGNMLDPKFAISVFNKHFQAAGEPAPGFTYLELGPGDSLACAVIAHAYGARRGWLIDSGAYASRDMVIYSRLIAELRKSKTYISLPPHLGNGNLGELLAWSKAEYLKDGLASFSQIPSNSCDMVFSQAVLEHVPKSDFPRVISEIYRILKSGGVSSHDVDFQDHLGGGLNNLRFSDRLWEAPWFAQNSGFYTNRLLFSQMNQVFRNMGFIVELLAKDKWPRVPLPKKKLNAKFRNVQDTDLRVYRAYFRLLKTKDHYFGSTI